MPDLDDLVDAICDRWFEDGGDGAPATYTDRYEYVPVVLSILRSLPVRDRVAAMGMLPVTIDWHYEQTTIDDGQVPAREVEKHAWPMFIDAAGVVYRRPYDEDDMRPCSVAGCDHDDVWYELNGADVCSEHGGLNG
jgi:hypothetical protein